MKDETAYKWAGYTLQVGMFTSLGAMTIGLLWWLAIGSPGGVDVASSVIPLDRLFAELGALNPLALLNAGILLLLATPGVTLIAQIAAFLTNGNLRWAGIATVVALMLLTSLLIAFGLFG